MSGSHRENLPAEVALRLRQEANFGCCKCGNPILQYHHIIPYSRDQHFRPDDMMVLCPACHELVTNGHVSEAKQREWKSSPYNKVQGNPRGLLWIEQRDLIIRFGTSTVKNCPDCLYIKGETIIKITHDESGRLLLSLRLRDEHDNLLIEISDNEWTFGDSSPWDIEAKWRYLKVRQKAGEILMTVDARSEPVCITGYFRKSGSHVVIGNDTIKVNDNLIIPEMHISDGWYGIVVQ